MNHIIDFKSVNTFSEGIVKSSQEDVFDIEEGEGVENYFVPILEQFKGLSVALYIFEKNDLEQCH